MLKFSIFLIGALTATAFFLVLSSPDVNTFHYNNIKDGWVYSKNSLPEGLSIEKEAFIAQLKRIDPMLYFLIFLAAFGVLFAFKDEK